MVDHNVQREAAGSPTRRSEPRLAVIAEHGRHVPLAATRDEVAAESELVDDEAHSQERTTRRYAHTLQRGARTATLPPPIGSAPPVIPAAAAPAEQDEIAEPPTPEPTAPEAAAAPARTDPGNPVRSANGSTALYRRRPLHPARPDSSEHPERSEVFTLLDAVQSEMPDNEDSPSALPSVLYDVAGKALYLRIPRHPIARLVVPIALAVIAAVAVIWLLRAFL